MKHKVVLGALGGLAMSATALAAPASAAPVTQQGLVNLNISDVGVQIPVSLAANICDVNVAVLVQGLLDDAATCDASATPDAVLTLPDGGPVDQEGLVNVNVSNVAVQVPIGIAANVCDVNVGVLVGALIDDTSPCTSDAVSVSRITG